MSKEIQSNEQNKSAWDWKLNLNHIQVEKSKLSSIQKNILGIFIRFENLILYLSKYQLNQNRMNLLKNCLLYQSLFFHCIIYWSQEIHRENICLADQGGGSAIYPIHLDPLPSTPDAVSSNCHGSTATLICSRALSLDIWAPWSIPELFLGSSSTRIYSRVSHWIGSQLTLP